MEPYEISGLKKCGIGILIVNKEFKNPKGNRSGAEMEQEYLAALLEEEFSLELHKFTNVSDMQMVHIFSSLSGLRKRRRCPTIEARHNILVIAISSHGAKDGIYTSDSKLFKFSRIMRFFNGEDCELLISKPKLLLINCCRTLQDRVERNEKAFLTIPMSEKIETDSTSFPNCDLDANDDNTCLVSSSWSDFIRVCLCYRGMASLRSSEHGSLPVKELYQAFVSYGHTTDFMRFMTQFTRNVKKKIYLKMKDDKMSEHGAITQCPEVTTTLDRLLIFPQKNSDSLLPINNLHITPQNIDKYGAWAQLASHNSPPLAQEEESTKRAKVSEHAPFSENYANTQMRETNLHQLEDSTLCAMQENKSIYAEDSLHPVERKSTKRRLPNKSRYKPYSTGRSQADTVVSQTKLLSNTSGVNTCVPPVHPSNYSSNESLH